MFKKSMIPLVVALVDGDIISLSLLLVVITIALAFIALMIILGIALLLKKKDAREGRHPPIQETNDNEDGNWCLVPSFR